MADHPGGGDGDVVAGLRRLGPAGFTTLFLVQALLP